MLLPVGLCLLGWSDSIVVAMLLGIWMCHVLFWLKLVAWHCRCSSSGLLMLSTHCDAGYVLSGNIFSEMVGCCYSWLVGVINSAIVVSLALSFVVMCCIQFQACWLI